MTNISKRQLDPQHLEKLFTQLNATLAKLDKRNTDIFLSHLLGIEERIMLSKRFAIIVMLMEESSVYRIANTLKVSTSTVTGLLHLYENGYYDHLVKILRHNKTDYKKILEVLDVVLRAGMPPRGKGRWKSIFAMKE